jgi:hypothetical protein
MAGVSAPAGPKLVDQMFELINANFNTRRESALKVLQQIVLNSKRLPPRPSSNYPIVLPVTSSEREELSCIPELLKDQGFKLVLGDGEANLVSLKEWKP